MKQQHLDAVIEGCARVMAAHPFDCGCPACAMRRVKKPVEGSDRAMLVDAEKALGENLQWISDQADLAVRQQDRDACRRIAQLDETWKRIVKHLTFTQAVNLTEYFLYYAQHGRVVRFGAAYDQQAAEIASAMLARCTTDKSGLLYTMPTGHLPVHKIQSWSKDGGITVMADGMAVHAV